MSAFEIGLIYLVISQAGFLAMYHWDEANGDMPYFGYLWLATLFSPLMLLWGGVIRLIKLFGYTLEWGGPSSKDKWPSCKEGEFYCETVNRIGWFDGMWQHDMIRYTNIQTGEYEWHGRIATWFGIGKTNGRGFSLVKVTDCEPFTDHSRKPITDDEY